MYFDPPYHETFSGYGGLGFSTKEHEKLAVFCKQLNQNGALFMLSNSDTPFIRDLYKGFNIDICFSFHFL